MIKDYSEAKMEINLSGPGGNPFALLGVADKYCRMLGMDADKVLDEMRSSDYENLIQVFDSYFGHHVDLIRNSQ